eukprot:scaffold316324_cov35-Tisochrysis_lutea.AAC.3
MPRGGLWRERRDMGMAISEDPRPRARSAIIKRFCLVHLVVRNARLVMRNATCRSRSAYTGRPSRVCVIYAEEETTPTLRTESTLQAHSIPPKPY